MDSANKYNLAIEFKKNAYKLFKNAPTKEIFLKIYDSLMVYAFSLHNPIVVKLKLYRRI